MNHYTPQESGIIVSMYLTNNRLVVLDQRKICRRFPDCVAPTILRRLSARHEETSSTRAATDVADPGNSRLVV